MKVAVAIAFASMLIPAHAAEVPLVEGNAKSKVRVVVYEDLQCPDCAVYRKMMDEKLLPEFGAQVAFEHRDFPLPKHKWARKAAIAARFFAATKPETAVAFRRMTMRVCQEPRCGTRSGYRGAGRCAIRSAGRRRLSGRYRERHFEDADSLRRR
jgi:hypothetical protein